MLSSVELLELYNLWVCELLHLGKLTPLQARAPSSYYTPV